MLGPLPRLGGMRRQWAGSPKLDSHGPHPSLKVVGEFDQNLLPDWCKRWKPPEVSISHAGDSGFWGGRVLILQWAPGLAPLRPQALSVPSQRFSPSQGPVLQRFLVQQAKACSSEGCSLFLSEDPGSPLTHRPCSQRAVLLTPLSTAAPKGYQIPPSLT